MVKKWLSYILASLIALQSLAAIADDHLIHQSGVQHVEDEHKYASGLVDVEASHEYEQDTSTSNQHDCQHCCHCHGLAQFIIDSDRDIGISRSRQRLSEYNQSYLSNLLFPDIRPPIV